MRTMYDWQQKNEPDNSIDACIGLVTDTSTGLANGSITPNEEIQIDGSNIKIVGDDPVVGIFFVSENGETTVQAPSRLSKNEPEHLVARVPSLAEDRYILRIVTQNNETEGKQRVVQILDYNKRLTVISGTGE